MGQSQWVWWGLGIALVFGGAILGYMEYHVYLLRTKVTDVPNGIRFTSQDLVVEVQRPAKQVLVHARQGTFTRKAMEEGSEDQVESGELSLTLAAIGLKIDIVRHAIKLPDKEETIPTGFCQLVFSTSDELVNTLEDKGVSERSVLRIDGVPNKVATDFHLFVTQVQVWIDKLEQGIHQELEARRKKAEAEAAAIRAAEEAKAKAEAEAARLEAAKIPDLSPAEREAAAAPIIAQWRKTAGFTGTSSEVGISPKGKIEWYIDLDPRGRITLHSNDRTIHTTLQGATIASVGGELEIGVRDEYWTEDEPALKHFRILKGIPVDTRRAWMERLEILRDSMPSSNVPAKR